MKFKAKNLGSITDKEGNKTRFWPGQVIDVAKSNYAFDLDEHPGFERADENSKKSTSK